ncbi:MAG: VTT domain-containing protein [Acetobacteraceae bacterium]|nr:VTT domain-containing protein [Acetobacteraceae bacterium]
MDLVIGLVRDYGVLTYLLLFAYTALKSGVLPLLAGYAAQAGALDVGVVAGVTFLGGYGGDEARFWLTRRFGARMFEGRPRMLAMVAASRAVLARYGAAYIFLYRYPKGMRTVGALPVGLTDMAWRRFTVLNAASAGLWTVLLVGAGFVFGASIDRAVAQGWGAWSALLLIPFLGVGYLAWRRVRALAVGVAPGS